MKKWFPFFILLTSLIIFPHFFWNFVESAGPCQAGAEGGACSRNDPSLCLDSDGDGVVDSSDNCPNHFNPKQTDENQNRIGDLCEGLPQPATCEELLQCESMDDCMPYFDAIVATCPNLEELGEDPFFLCCDSRCTNWNPETGSCPAGTCFTPGGHCSIDAECPQDMPTCLEGCCISFGEEICPNGEPPLQCCPPEEVCEDPVFPPCPEGEICDPTGCCIPPPDSCPEFLACDFGSESADAFCGDLLLQEFDLPLEGACCEESGCCNHCEMGGCGCGGG